ncbi:TPA: polysaccharide deacetylase family protein, partial [Bacillus wiedmannii]
MYYFYSSEMFAPYQWGLERDVSYGYMPYNSFYYGDNISALPYVYIPQNYEVQMKTDERGS